MKKVSENKKLKKGFTLIEMLVVVLIIGILAAIALPQYQMAVTKSKVAAILPIMRAFKDALMEYNLQHGSYFTEDRDYPDADTLGVNWPSDWECQDEYKLSCSNDYWTCIANEYFDNGTVACINRDFAIYMYQSDYSYEDFRGLMICDVRSEVGLKICKALGGKLIDGDNYSYKLN